LLKIEDFKLKQIIEIKSTSSEVKKHQNLKISFGVIGNFKHMPLNVFVEGNKVTFLYLTL
jgi:hypothetical protein